MAQARLALRQSSLTPDKIHFVNLYPNIYWEPIFVQNKVAFLSVITVMWK